MRYWIPVLVLTAFNVGCTSMALERHAVSQIATVTDLRFQQVMENLALLAADPDDLPSFAVVAEGTLTVTQSASLDAKTLWTRAMFRGFASETITPGATNNPAPQWTLDPVADHEKVEALRAALRVVLYGCPQLGSDDAKRLKQFQIDHELAKLPCGWLHVGKLTDVPLSACYQAHNHGTYVWVMPEGMAGLSNFTLIVLDIGTVSLESIRSNFSPVAAVKVTASQLDNDQRTLQYTGPVKENPSGSYAVPIASPAGVVRPPLSLDQQLLKNWAFPTTPSPPWNGPTWPGTDNVQSRPQPVVLPTDSIPPSRIKQKVDNAQLRSLIR